MKSDHYHSLFFILFFLKNGQAYVSPQNFHPAYHKFQVINLNRKLRTVNLIHHRPHEIFAIKPMSDGERMGKSISPSFPLENLFIMIAILPVVGSLLFPYLLSE